MRGAVRAERMRAAAAGQHRRGGKIAPICAARSDAVDVSPVTDRRCSMGRRFNYANVTATLALFFAMSGGALAAKHYLINSTKQISPKVLSALKGRRGPAGPTGATGAAGAGGKEGPQGKEGSQGKEGLQGKDGARGETGPSHAYSTAVTEKAQEVSATVTVPAGSYAITGSGQFVNETSGSSNYGVGECEIQAPAGTKLAERLASVPNIGIGEIVQHGEASIAIEGVAQLKEAGKILARCTEQKESTHIVRVTKVSVTATLLGAVN
jgi:hypothetical protein